MEDDPVDIHLVQHGLALSEDHDPQRPLSPAGRADTTRVAQHLATLGRLLIDPPIVEVRHSGKLRARQTAEILARVLCPQIESTAHAGMNPGDDPRPLAYELDAKRHRNDALLLVGHLPYLAHLAGLLLTGDAERTPVSFVNSAVLKLRFAESGWVVAWYLTPACVP
jgi:phosphohistidine phosphatase